MPIVESDGSMFESGADILINPVNCVGVMGKGLALEFSKRYPCILPEYRDWCKTTECFAGAIRMCSVSKPRILLFATKDHWRNPSKLEWITSGLLMTRHLYTSVGRCHDTIAIPALGCGLGGLEWEEVKKAIIRILGDVQNKVIIFNPQGKI